MSNIYNELLPNIVSYWDFRSGGINDRIGSNHLSFNSTPVFQNKNGLSLDGTDDYVTETIANYQSSDSTGSVVALVKTEDVSVSQTIFHSGDTATNNYYTRLTLDTLGRINWAQKNNDTADEIRGQTDISGNEYRLVTLTSSGTAYTIYLDNASETISVDGGSNSGDWFADTDNRDNINIGVQKNSTVNWYWNGNIKFVMLLDKALTGQEVAELYDLSKTEYGNKEKKHTFYLPSNVDNSDSTLVAGYNMDVDGSGIVQDVTGAYPGTLTGGAVQEQGVFDNALLLDGNEGRVDTGSTDYIGTGDITVAGLIKLNGFGGGGFGRIFENGKFTIYTSDNMLTMISDGSTGATSAAGTLKLNEWIHFVLVRPSGGDNCIFYIDGNDATNLADSGTPAGAISNLFIGNNSGSNRGLDGVLDNMRIFNEIKNATWIADDYAKFAETLTYRDSLKDANVSTGNVTAGYLENTDWQVNSGAYQVKYDSTEDARYYSCETAGVAYTSSDMAYGTWEFDVYKDADGNTMQIIFIANVIGTKAASGQEAYVLTINNVEGIQLEKAGTGGGDLMVSAAGLLSLQTWYRIKVTRRYDGQFTVYFSSDNGITYTQVVAASGSNPVTNNVTTTSNYTSLDNDPGDRVKNLTFSRGIV